jgi:serine/threonine protein kinase
MARKMIGSRYRIERQLTSDSFTDFFLGHDLVLLRPVAIRTLCIDRWTPDRAIDQFLKVGQILGGIENRHLPTIYAIGDDRSDPYIVHEYIPGQSLRQIIDDEGPFHPDDVAILIEQVANGLDAAAQHGLFHGALSPDAVVVNADGLAKIDRFAAPHSADLTSDIKRNDASPSDRYQPSLPGTEHLAPQERDGYALAAIAYEMLVGQLPTSLSTAPTESRETRIAHPSQVNPEIPIQAGDIVVRMLERTAAGQKPLMSGFANELTNWRYVQGATKRAKAEEPTASAGTERRHPRPGARNPARANGPLPPQPRPETQPGPRLEPVDPLRLKRRTPVRWLGLGALGFALAALALLWNSLEPAAVPSSGDQPNDPVEVISTPTPTPEVTASLLNNASVSPFAPTLRSRIEAVVGLPYDEASRRLTDLGIEVHRLDVNDERLPSGIVVGFELIETDMPHRQVALVTSGGNLTQIPYELFGMPVEEGMARLEEEGISTNGAIGVDSALIESFGIDLTAMAIEDGDIVGIQNEGMSIGSSIAPGASVTLVYYNAKLDELGLNTHR